MKRLLVIVGIMIGLAGLSAGAGWFLIDWTAVRAAAIMRLGAATGVDIAIDGDVEIKALPRPAVRLTGLRVAPAGLGANTILAAEQVDLVPNLLPLLRGEIGFDSVVLDGVSISLERGKDGQGNWEALKNAFGAQAGDTDGDGLQPLAIAIRKGTLYFADRKTGTETVLSGVSATLRTGGADGWRAEGGLTWRGLPLTLAGALAKPSPAGMRSFDLTLKLDKQATATASGQLHLGAGTVSGGRVKIDAPDLPAAVKRIDNRIVVPPTFKELAIQGGFVFEKGKAEFADLRGRAGPVSATAKLSIVASGKPSFTASVDILTLPVDPLVDLALGLPPPKDEPKPGGGIDGRITLTVDAARYRSSAVRNVSIAAHIHDGALTVEKASGVAPGGTRVSFDGQAAPRGGQAVFEGAVTGESDDLRAFLGWLGVDLSGIPAERFRRGEVESSLRLDDWHLILDGFRFKVDALDVSGTFAMPWHEQRPIGVVLDINALDLDAYAGGVGADSAPGRSLDGQAKVHKLTIAGQTFENVYVDAIWNGVEANVRGFNVDIPGTEGLTGKGKFTVAAKTPKFTGTIEAKSNRPAEIARWLGFTPGPGLLGRHDLSLEAAIEAAVPRVAVSSLLMRFDKSTIKGGVSLVVEDGRPKVDAEIAVDRWSVPLPHDETAAVTGSLPGLTWSPDVMDFRWLTGFDANIKAEAQNLKADRYNLQDVRLEARVREGRIGLEWLEGKGYGGAVRARGFLDAREAVPRYAANVEFADIGLGALLKDAANYTALDGVANLVADLRGAGKSEIDLIRATEGSVKVTAAQGTYDGIDVDRVSDRLRNLENIGDIGPLLRATEAGGQTQVQRVSADWTIAGGVASTDNLKAELRSAVMEAAGRIDVPLLSIDLRGAVRFVTAAGEPSLGFTIRGPVSEPVQELKTGRLKDYIQKRINDHAMGKAEPPPPLPAIEEVLPESVRLPELTRREGRRQER